MYRYARFALVLPYSAFIVTDGNRADDAGCCKRFSAIAAGRRAGGDVHRPLDQLPTSTSATASFTSRCAVSAGGSIAT